ncbi:hypothetical protein [Proteus terrae]|uniref:hypothetical protein n=1 Tax=Proteus terrae TaxID=1574161 RepID=UPI0034D4CF9F
MDKMNENPLSRDDFFKKIKKVTIKKFKEIIEADGVAKMKCYRCGSSFLQVQTESTDENHSNQRDVSYLTPSYLNYKYERETDNDDDEYDLNNYQYRLICTRCTAEMTFNTGMIIDKIEKYNGDES